MKKILVLALFMFIKVVSAHGYESKYKYKHISLNKTALFATKCVEILDPNFKGDYIFSTGQYRLTAPKFGVMIGIKTTNIVGEKWIRYARCKFYLKDGSHSDIDLDLDPSNTRVKLYGEIIGVGSIK